jgi:hypothetical protein
LRAGMPDDSGDLAVNTRTHTHYQYARTRLRVHWAPGIPHALMLSGRNISAKTSGARRRENAMACQCGPAVINSPKGHIAALSRGSRV